MHRHTFAAAMLAGLALPVHAFAQATPEPDVVTSEPSVFDGDYLTVGGAVYSTPSYEGSDKNTIGGLPLVRGELAGIGISPHAGGVALDFIQDPKEARIGFSFGPLVTYTRNRAHGIKDSVVESAGKLKSAVDVGASGGVTGYKLLNPYDSLSLSVDVKWNVNSAYKGMVYSPTITYATPLSKGSLVTLSGFAKHVDSDYASYYYGVTAAQSTASGLAKYTASKGWASVGGALLAAYDLNGNLLDGGFAIVAGASYTKLLNDAKHTPYTSVRGDDTQWTFGGGLAYTF